MKLPIDPIGYLVTEGGDIHTRYATHAKGNRTRTEKGVKTLLNGKRGKACKECYGNTPAPKPESPRSPQQRRVSSNGDTASMPRG